jgi:hypothetical protein
LCALSSRRGLRLPGDNHRQRLLQTLSNYLAW